MAPAASVDASFRDRTFRLHLFGALAVLCGGAAVLLGLLHLLLIFVDLPAGLETDRVSLATSMLTFGGVGGVLIWAGVGSLQRRRWVRSVMLIIGSTWLIGGILASLLIAAMLDDLLALARIDLPPLPPEQEWLVKIVVLALTGGAGLVLPAAFVWAYRDVDVSRTCAAVDPATDWTAGCPLPVLGLSLGLAALAVVSLPLALRPAVPWFGRLATGWEGSLILLLGAAAAAWLARSTFRLRLSGWWGTNLIVVLTGISTAVTFVRTDASEYYRAMGYPEEQLTVLARSAASSRWVTVGGTTVLTLLTLVYMGAIRRHFGSGSRESGS